MHHFDAEARVSLHFEEEKYTLRGLPASCGRLWALAHDKCQVGNAGFTKGRCSWKRMSMCDFKVHDPSCKISRFEVLTFSDRVSIEQTS